MATPAFDLVRLQLPTRIRASTAANNGIAYRYLLADRSTALPNIKIVRDNASGLPCDVSLYLQEPEILLGHFGAGGIRLRGLSDADRHRLVAKGWARLTADGVIIFLPRNDRELEICWNIVFHAYSSITESSARVPRVQSSKYGNTPRFSRTSLQ